PHQVFSELPVLIVRDYKGTIIFCFCKGFPDFFEKTSEKEAEAEFCLDGTAMGVRASCHHGKVLPAEENAGVRAPSLIDGV
ncbi:MAG: hypothetical protein J5939_06215, partial [Bacteroidales bacterium]|nr:hypothetical protein [Bacteroidales bacterium]